MTRRCGLIALLALALAAPGCRRSPSAMPFNCVGHWRVFDASRNPYYLTVHEDGRAVSTLPHQGEGRWAVEEQHVRIVWQDRRIDYLVVTDEGVSRVGCAPGETLHDIPTSASVAVRVDAVPPI